MIFSPIAGRREGEGGGNQERKNGEGAIHSTG